MEEIVDVNVFKIMTLLTFWHYDIFSSFKTIILCCVLCNSWNMCFLLKQITRTLNWTQHDCVDLMWDDNLQHLCQFLLMKIMFYIAVSYSSCPNISYYALVNYFFQESKILVVFSYCQVWIIVFLWSWQYFWEK